MKLKRILAGALTAVMMLASVPVTGLNVSAAALVIDAPALSMSAEPKMEGQASDSQIVVEGADAGVQSATSDSNESYAVSGNTKFLVKFKLKVNADASSIGSGKTICNSGGDQGWHLDMRTDYILIWGNVDSTQSGSKWAQTLYTFGGNNLSLNDFLGKWHEVAVGYNGVNYVLYIDDKAGTVDSVGGRVTEYTLKEGGAQSTISFGTAGFDANITDAKVYIDDQVPDLSTATGVGSIDFTGKTSTGNALGSSTTTGNFVADSKTVWTKDGSEVSTFESGTYVGTTKLMAKDGYVFSNESLPTAEGFAATVSEDGKTMTVTKTVTFAATEYAQNYLAEVEKLLEKNVFSEASTATVTTAKNELQTAVENSSADIEAKITALKAAIQASEITMSRRYAEPVVGQAVAMTEDDRLFYGIANSLTVDVVYKFNTIPAEGNQARALFTLSNKAGNYITVWYVPNLSGDGDANKGAICFVGDGATGGFYFSKENWGTVDTNWHKMSLSFSNKNTMLCIAKDGANAFAWNTTANNTTTGNTWEIDALNPMRKLIGTHEWQVEEILVGKKAEGATYPAPNASTTVSDVAITDGTPELEMKYIEVSARTYSDGAGIDGSKNKQDAEIVKERDALVAEKEALTETDYTADSWTAYANACSEASAATTDWDMLNKIDALKTAKEGLATPRFTGTTLTLDGKIGFTFYTNLTSMDGVTAASFTVDNNKTVEATAELKNGFVACTYDLAAKEMTDLVSASITVNGETISSGLTSAAANAYALLNDTNSTDALKALVKSLVNYGAAAQAQFNYKTENPANGILTEATDKVVPEIGTNLDATCATMGVTAEGYKGLSLVLNSETALKLYATTDASIVLKKDGTQVAASGTKKNNGFSFVKVENIAANHLQDTYTVEIDGTEVGTVSPLLYCYNVTKGTNFDANLKNLVNALYDYNQKAIAYSPSQN